MPRPSSRRWIVLAAVVVLLLTSLCLRRIPAGEVAVRESALLGLDPAPLGPGWHLAPRWLVRLNRYPSGPLTRDFGHDTPLQFTSQEGSTMLASGTVQLELPAGSALSLHAASRGDFDGWLVKRLEELVYGLLSSPQFVPMTRDRLPEMEQEGARLLGEALGPAGVRVAALRLESIGYEGGLLLTAGRAPGARRKVLWIAVDSFDWDIIEPLIGKGRMPVMAGLRERGAWGRLQTRPPLISPVLWTSIATGMGPEKHGIVDFVATDPSTGAILPVTSTLRRTSAFWNILGESGVSVGVVAWWASFPAEHVNGFMATDRIAFQLFKEMFKDQPEDNPLKVYPSHLWSRVAPLIRAPGEVGPEELDRFIDMQRHAAGFTADDTSRINEFRTLLAATRTYLDIGRTLFREMPTDVRVLYFEGPDTSAHLFMPFAPPAPEGTDPRLAEAFGGVVDSFYSYQDQLIGELIDEFADEETTIIVCSDHGFLSGADRPKTESRIGKGKASDWHARDGVILFAGKDIQPGVRILGAGILDIVPTLLALYGLPVGEDMMGNVLTSAIAPEFLAARPVTTIASWEEEIRPREPQVTQLTQDDQDLLDKLTSLGYIEQDRPSAIGNSAIIQLQAGESGKAIELIKSVLEEMDTEQGRLILAQAYRMDGKPDLARAELERLLASGWNRPGVLTELAALNRESGAYREAEKMLLEAATERPDDSEIHMQLARLYEQTGRLDLALSSYRRVVEIKPASSLALNQMGLILGRMGRNDEAMRELTRAIEVNPDDHFAYNSLGLLYRRLGMPDKARQMIETGITMAPRSAILHNSLATVLLDAGRTDAAIASLEEAVVIDPDYGEAMVNLATIHRGRGETAKANAWADRLLALDSGRSTVRVSLAQILSALGRTDDAVRVLESVLGQEPDDFRALVSLARIRVGRGDHRGAATLLERAGRIQGAVPQLWNDLAEVYVHLGRTEEARSALRRSMQLDPDQPEIARRLGEMGG